MSLIQDLGGVMLGRPRVIQKTKLRCTICGRRIPKGRHDTCGYKCKGVKDRAARIIYDIAHRRLEFLQRRARADRLMEKHDALGGLFR